MGVQTKLSLRSFKQDLFRKYIRVADINCGRRSTRHRRTVLFSHTGNTVTSFVHPESTQYTEWTRLKYRYTKSKDQRKRRKKNVVDIEEKKGNQFYICERVTEHGCVLMKKRHFRCTSIVFTDVTVVQLQFWVHARNVLMHTHTESRIFIKVGKSVDP